MILTLLSSLLINITAVNTPVRKQTEITNPNKIIQTQAYYVTSISNKDALNEITKKAKDNFGIELKFKRVKYSKLEKIRNIKIIATHDTFKHEAEFNNIFEITPIEITLNKDTDGKVTCRIVELMTK